MSVQKKSQRPGKLFVCEHSCKKWKDFVFVRYAMLCSCCYCKVTHKRAHSGQASRWSGTALFDELVFELGTRINLWRRQKNVKFMNGFLILYRVFFSIFHQAENIRNCQEIQSFAWYLNAAPKLKFRIN